MTLRSMPFEFEKGKVIRHSPSAVYRRFFNTLACPIAQVRLFRIAIVCPFPTLATTTKLLALHLESSRPESKRCVLQDLDPGAQAVEGQHYTECLSAADKNKDIE